MEKKKIRIGITHGDLCGVGYEVILKTFAYPMMCEMCIPVLYGCLWQRAYRHDQG
jgi:4-hydroxythreonine-4-phosphate dehydrogenase